MSPSPDLHSNFMEFMLEHNRSRMAGFKSWVFQPGMLFNAPGKWWGDQGPRYIPHEGLDLYSFLDANGTKQTVNQHTRIPAAFAGAIVKIDPDFLGKSIYLSHEIFSASGRQLISVYGHTIPRQSLQAGENVAAGEIIGLISGFPEKKTSLVPHLHITFAWVPVPVPLNHLDWRNLGNNSGITLVDPLAVISPLAGNQATGKPPFGKK
jgi:murein DD-endopeptidase MepM/ murein hydrolase activator NlpD